MKAKEKEDIIPTIAKIMGIEPADEGEETPIIS